jgi:sugar phosphate isomerase/epimerase
MNNDMQRRGFLMRSMGITACSALSLAPKPALAVSELKRIPGTKIKIALNSYSFNRPLTAGKMTLDDVIDYCAQHDIDGVDTTGYYFPGYPKVPTDEYIYNLKKKAYLNGVTINGTGVRNDFTLPDASRREGEIQLVKDWIEVARKIGANVIRVFSGRELPKGYTFDQVLEWMIPAFKECAEYGKQRGVIVGLQHHDDFLKTADQTIRVVKAVNSDWFSVILDVGSLRQGDPYEEIEKLLPYACTWQIKESVWYGQKSTPIDLARVRAIIGKVGFRGFLPIEALGQGDPAVVVTSFLEKVRKAMV